MVYHVFTGSTTDGNAFESMAICEETVESSDFNVNDYFFTEYQEDINEDGTVDIEGDADHLFPDHFSIKG